MTIASDGSEGTEPHQGGSDQPAQEKTARERELELELAILRERTGNSLKASANPEPASSGRAFTLLAACVVLGPLVIFLAVLSAKDLTAGRDQGLSTVLLGLMAFAGVGVYKLARATARAFKSSKH